MANRFHGSFRKIAEKSRDGGPRGVARMDRQLKVAEAALRNVATVPWRTKRHRRWCTETTHDSYCTALSN